MGPRLSRESLTNSLASDLLDSFGISKSDDLGEVNEIASRIARERAGRLITNLTDAKRRRVRLLTQRAIDYGWTDKELADRLAQHVGLDERFTNAVENYRLALIGNKTPRGKARKMAENYAKDLRRARAHRIATTEVHTALLEAQRELWTEAQERGDLSPYAVRVTRTRKDCCTTTCRKHNGQRSSLKAGSKGGPPFHPNCRCYEEVEDQGVVKHLPGLHNQKTHGRKHGMRVANLLGRDRHREHMNAFRSGKFWRSLNEFADAHPNSPQVQGFRQGVSHMAQRFPNVARTLEHFVVNPPGLSENAIAAVTGFSNDRGFSMAVNVNRLMDEAHVERAMTGDRRYRATGRRFTTQSTEFDPAKWAYAVAVHEFGHVVHAFFLNQIYEHNRPGQLHQITDAMTYLGHRYDMPEVFPSVDLTEYAEQSEAERFAEFWAHAVLNRLPEEHKIPEFWDTLLSLDPLPVRDNGVIIRKDEGWHVDRFDKPCFADEYAVTGDDVMGTVKKGLTISPGGRVADDSSLNRSPKKNWIERAGGLPRYIRMVANALVRAGHPRARAIPMAIGIVRNWAQGKGNVRPKVRAAAAKAIAEWELKKAKGNVRKDETTGWDFDVYQEARAQLRDDGII